MYQANKKKRKTPAGKRGKSRQKEQQEKEETQD